MPTLFIALSSIVVPVLAKIRIDLSTAELIFIEDHVSAPYKKAV